MLPETLTVGQVLLFGAGAMLVIVLRIALAATGIWPAWRERSGSEGSGSDSGLFGDCGDGGGGD